MTTAPDGGGLTEAELPRRVRDLRMRRGLSLRAAAVEIGMSFNTLTRIEQGYEYENRHNAVLLRWLATDDGSCSACGSTSTAQGLTEAERETLAREWHAMSDHAADGTPFGGGLCNCMAQAVRVERILAARSTEMVAAAWDEAADLLAPFSGIGMGSQPTRSEVSAWLRLRAAAIREGSDT